MFMFKEDIKAAFCVRFFFVSPIMLFMACDGPNPAHFTRCACYEYALGKSPNMSWKCA